MANTGSVDLLTAPVIRFATIGSTNEEGLRRARSGERGPLWLRADVQTSGRGRLGRPWSSPTGNLHTSLVLHAPAEMQCLPQLAHVAGVALAQAVGEVIGAAHRLALKWPNDLLHNGAKVAGILVEGTQAPDGRPACVIGMGINCAWHPEGLAYPTTDLTTLAGRPIAPDTLFAALRYAMNDALRLWNRGTGYAGIREAWLQRAIAFGTALVVKGGATAVHGTFQGIDLQGRLLVGGPAGIAAIEAGDVVLSDGSAAMVG